jgi:hypothetical protein
LGHRPRARPVPGVPQCLGHPAPSGLNTSICETGHLFAI